MLEHLGKIGQELANITKGARALTLEEICNIVKMRSFIDEIIYTGYSVSKTNPIWGQFWKYGRHPNMYAPFTVTVEIRYASHLDKNWRRFVVCKELCHALDADEGSHSVSDRSVDKIIASFALFSSRGSIEPSHRAIQAEWLAEVGAIELLCPVSLRENIPQSEGANACKAHGIPLEFCEAAF